VRNGFPATAAEFYARRDDRTNRYVGKPTYALKSVMVTADDDALETISGQVLLLVSCNLLSRWCRAAYIDVRDVEPYPQLNLGGTSLLRNILDQMKDADPFGRVKIVNSSAPPTDLRFHVGSTCIDGGSRATCVTSTGWQAAVCRSGHVGLNFDQSSNCAGALFAAVLGSAQLFRDAVGMSGFLADRFLFDGLLLQSMPDSEPAMIHPFVNEFDIGRVLMVGAGSVGSSAGYCMRLLGLRGRLTIVDADIVEVVNFNRSPTFGKSYFGLNKASALSKFLEGGPITVESHDLWWKEYAGSGAASPGEFDIWLPLANEFGVRPNMAQRVPPLMIQASTSQNWGVNFGRHIPGRDECLIERFAGLPSGSDFMCAAGEITDGAGNKADAALPFLSFFAGLLVAVDIVRLGMTGYPQVPNFGAFDFGGADFRPLLAERKPHALCLCQSGAYRNLFHRLRGQAKYDSLASWESRSDSAQVTVYN
jgi:hypothetical protein